MEDLRITGLTLNKVGVFDHLELSFEKLPLKDKAEIHIFTGQNGTGKTTLLEALTSFDKVFNTFLKEEKRVWRKDDPLVLKEQEIENDESEVKNMKFHIAIYFHNREMRTTFNQGTYFDNMDIFKLYYEDTRNFSKHHSYNFFAYNGQRRIHDSAIQVLKPFDFNSIKEALTFNKNNTNDNLFQWIANNKTRAALSFQKGNNSDSYSYLNLINRIETAIGEIVGRKVQFIIDVPTLTLKVNLDDHPIPFNTLADGYKSIISWLTDLMFRLDYMPEEGRENFTLFLDEIDIHLHPAAQRRILPVIQKLFPKAQIFLTTHSPFVIGSVDDAWIYKFKLDENGHSVLDGPPLRSEDGKSYRYILEEVFDIKEQFGDEVEIKLDDFNRMRNEVIKNPSEELISQLTRVSRELASQSIELQSMMGSELKQLSRILKTEITL